MKYVITLTILFCASIVIGQNTGIGTTNPQEKLEVAGAVKIGNTANNNAGVIRYGTDNELRGNQGSGWKSLVSSGTSYFYTGFSSTVRNANVVIPFTITVPSDGQYVIILTSDLQNTINSSSGGFDAQGYVYLKVAGGTILLHHAAKNEVETTTTGYVISLETAEFPKISLANLSKNDVLTVEARLDTAGTPTPTSQWNLNSLSIILVKLN